MAGMWQLLASSSMKIRCFVRTGGYALFLFTESGADYKDVAVIRPIENSYFPHHASLCEGGTTTCICRTAVVAGGTFYTACHIWMWELTFRNDVTPNGGGMRGPRTHSAACPVLSCPVLDYVGGEPGMMQIQPGAKPGGLTSVTQADRRIRAVKQ